MIETFIDLSGKTFIVTGATSGIGTETCNQIIKYGGGVIAIGRSMEKLKVLQDTFSVPIKTIHYDLEDIDNIDQIISQIDAPIDGIVHSAGIVKLMPIKFLDINQFRKLRDVNYDSILLIFSKLLKSKKIAKGSSVVLISSIAGSMGMKGNLIYSATKAALDISVKVFAAELSNMGIRFNTIAPGQVETPLTAAVASTVSEDAIEKDRAKYPLGYGKPDDVANLAIFLLSDKSRWITGTNIIIDGGRSNVLN